MYFYYGTEPAINALESPGSLPRLGQDTSIFEVAQRMVILRSSNGLIVILRLLLVGVVNGKEVK